MSNSELVLVTGATGFIGGYCVKLLLEKGYSVRATVQSVADTKKYQHLVDLDNGSRKKNLEFCQLDVLNKQDWDAAVRGCTYVLHVASPNPPKDISEKKIIEPAINGTRYAMEACLQHNVKRVVITSSIVACVPDDIKNLKRTDETHFTSANKVSHYRKSKILAELEAWKIYEANKDKIEMAIILPALVMGRNLTDRFYTSALFIKSMLNDDYPSIPQFKEPMVSVVDIAEAHIRAMIVPEANGQRFIISQGTYYLRILAQILKKQYEAKGYKIAQSDMGYCMFSLVAFFFSYLKGAKPFYKLDFTYDNRKSIDVLKMEYRPIEPVVLETAEWLIESGHVKKKPRL